jgi:hypothetical protein
MTVNEDPPMHRVRVLVLLPLIAVVVACSADPSSTPATSAGAAPASGPASSATAIGSAAVSAGDDAWAIYREYAACVRQHGLPSFPDPIPGANGGPREPVDAPLIPDSIISACSSIGERLPPEAGPTPAPPDVFAGWLAFAACMRSHGLPDWPDPEADGSFGLPASIMSLGKGPVAAAARDCAGVNPFPAGPLPLHVQH